MYKRRNGWASQNARRLPCLLLFIFLACNSQSEKHEASLPASFGFGRPASDSLIASMDEDVRPDGKGLPAGSGTVSVGLIVYAAKCASCHGKTGTEGPQSRLVAPIGDSLKEKAIGNYWPYSTTLFDYIKRAMPYASPGSLTNNEVYSLCAYLLWANKIIDSTAYLNAGNLYKVAMPARQSFIPDDRRGGPEIR